MATLLTKPASEAWRSLEWSQGRLVQVAALGQPLDAPEMPREPGIYRLTWLDEESWDRLGRSVRVKASAKIHDAVISLEGLRPPVVLTIGRTTNLRKRMRQHFGQNPNNNRTWKRLSDLSGSLCPEDLRSLAIQAIQVEWVVLPNWVDRFVLERYGCALSQPILDFDAEH